jgi:glutamine synthetase
MKRASSLADSIAASDVDTVRFAWCDLHGALRSKLLTQKAALTAAASGVGMVSTLLLKDTADKTAFKVFEPAIQNRLPRFALGGNLLLAPVADTYRVMRTGSAPYGLVLCHAHHHEDGLTGAPVAADVRAQLARATQMLKDAHQLQMMCGLEIEFHVYRINPDAHKAYADPSQAGWPGPAPDASALQLLHPGYRLLSDDYANDCEDVLTILRRTCDVLNLPLSSLEIEFGPSQFEAVFEPTEALQAADNMSLFKSAVRHALKRAGYYASFACRPPFPKIMSSGWHLHHSLQDVEGVNAFAPANAELLSEIGTHWLGGLLHHARGNTLFACPTLSGFARFQPNALAPNGIGWGADNRGAMLRVISAGAATRIENRAGEPLANPYLYLASQIHAGLSGIKQTLKPGPANNDPYGVNTPKLPHNITEAVTALEEDKTLCQGFGAEFIDIYTQVKRLEQSRFNEATDKTRWMADEYFARG